MVAQQIFLGIFGKEVSTIWLIRAMGLFQFHGIPFGLKTRFKKDRLSRQPRFLASAYTYPGEPFP